MGTMNQGGHQNPGGGPPPPGGYPPPGGPPPPGNYPPPQNSGSGLDDNVAGLLCYLPFLLGLVASIIFLVLEPYNRNALIRFHAFQSIFLAVTLFVLGFVLGIVGIILGMIPFLGWVGSIISALLSLVLAFGAVIVYLYLMFKTYNGQRIVLPLIGEQAEKQARG
jgi:uncharacterized membrane protein